MPRFSERVEAELRAAGWLPGRVVDVEFWRQRLAADGLIEMHAAAAEFLSEFGGLRLDLDGPGLTMARTPLSFDPMRGDGEEERFAEWGQEVEMSLFPIGSLESERFCLGMSETGEIFLVEAWLASFGLGDAAVENLILGVMPVTLDND